MRTPKCEVVQLAVSSHEINSRKINTHQINSYLINFPRDQLPRNQFLTRSTHTNNYVGGWHSRIKKIVGKAHPNIFELVEVFQKEEVTSRMKLQQFDSGAVLSARRRMVRERERRFQTLFSRMKDGD